MKSSLQRAHWFATQQVGIDLIRLARFPFAIPWFVRDMLRFRRAYQGEMSLFPCLHDRHEQAGSTATEYFAQDLLVAQKIFRAAPRNHLDIGSRIDGFVAHLASFREITVADIRPNASVIPNVTFTQADLMSPPDSLRAAFDSVSCLHTIEHFGLGRYGDAIDPTGYVSGLSNMAKLVMDGGTFYLSAPVGRERVEFNAHRVFDPRTLIDVARRNELSIESICFISPKGGLSDWDGSDHQIENIARERYALGVFTFKKSQQL